MDNGNDLDTYQEYRKLDDDQRQDMLDVGFEIIPLDKVKDNSYILVGSRYRVIVPRENTYNYVPLREIAEIIAGQSPEGSYYNTSGDGIPFYQGNADFGSVYLGAPRKWTTQVTKMTKIGDVLLSVRAPVGEVNLSDRNACIGRGLMALRPKNTIIDTKFLFYALKGASEKLCNFSAGSTFEAITKKDVEDFSIPVPSLEAQRQIVSELDSYQRIIDGARAVVEDYRPTIQIKSEWETKKLGNLFDVISELIEPQTLDGNVNYVGLENISVDTGELVGVVETNAKSIKSTKRYFERGDILYGKLRPNLNKVCVATLNGICSTDIIVLRPKNAGIVSEFYAVLLRDKEFNKSVLNGVTGGQLPRVDLDYFLSMPMYVVSEQEQEQICKQLELERTLVSPSKQLVDVFTKKMQTRINEMWGE